MSATSGGDGLPVQIDPSRPIPPGELSGPHPIVVPRRRRWPLLAFGVLSAVVFVGVAIGWRLAG